jgi:hypothetical protein
MLKNMPNPITNIKIRNLEPWIIPALYHQAETAGFKTLEGFLRQLLHTQAMQAQSAMVDELLQHLQNSPLQPDGFSDTLVRDARDELE